MPKLARPETLTEAVAASIRDAIVNGEFRPGEPLGELRLAAQLGTSRGTVREALRALADDGLVEILPHKGSSVSSVSIERVRDLYEVKLLLEPAAVAEAVNAGRLQAEYADELQAQLKRLKDAASQADGHAAITAERRLHEMLWTPCENQLLRNYLTTLHLQTRHILALTRPAERDPRAEYLQHQRLLHEVLSGDPERASAATRDHLAESMEAVLERLTTTSE